MISKDSLFFLWLSAGITFVLAILVNQRWHMPIWLFFGLIRWYMPIWLFFGLIMCLYLSLRGSEG